MTAVATFAGVSKSFRDVVAVSDLTVSIGTGMTAILGPNGAGKSTLMRLLVGLASPTSGEVRILGVDPRTDLDIHRRVGLVPQQEEVFSGMTGRAFVRTAADLCGLADTDARAARAIGMVELDPDDARPVSKYSKGMRQRIKIAQALVHDPEVVVLDEPLNGLDPRQRIRTIELFRQLAAEGRSVIVSSHVLSEVERFGSQIIVMVQGRLAAEGDFHSIRNLMNDRPVRVRVRSSDAARLASLLLGAGMVRAASITDDEVDLEVRDSTTFQRSLLQLAADAGISVRAVVPTDEDLESVFRYLMSRGTV